MKLLPLLLLLASAASADVQPDSETLAIIQERNAALRECADYEFNDPRRVPTCLRSDALEGQAETRGWCSARQADAPELWALPCESYRWVQARPSVYGPRFGVEIDALTASFRSELMELVRQPDGNLRETPVGFVAVICDRDGNDRLMFGFHGDVPFEEGTADVTMQIRRREISGEAIAIMGIAPSFTITDAAIIDAFLQRSYDEIGGYSSVDFAFTSRPGGLRTVLSVSAPRAERREDDFVRRAFANVVLACSR